MPFSLGLPSRFSRSNLWKHGNTVVDCGLWTVDEGLWTVDVWTSGRRRRKRPQETRDPTPTPYNRTEKAQSPRLKESKSHETRNTISVSVQRTAVQYCTLLEFGMHYFILYTTCNLQYLLYFLRFKFQVRRLQFSNCPSMTRYNNTSRRL